jgi:hypothetical protein
MIAFTIASLDVVTTVTGALEGLCSGTNTQFKASTASVATSLPDHLIFDHTRLSTHNLLQVIFLTTCSKPLAGLNTRPALYK